ncbi:hypothetical protein CGCA056_v009147 [Colletotrichum aenigma]|uniref:uncharacterized protein n=1 Tax=Colletotrichum aenigma TaxID=1215731 RepID=UPI001872D7A9|nr:uncharacterized protein CGCA056_v009147 [Colletotrichum aenigma]KAF5519026.1 hypothetical protein CGCA056_v009147 [Colletotrichum aenigma]KAH9226404.1 hypothetical protein K456DRAFT_58666 [Colletotrichum gloeosporioides 23]
MGRLENEQLSTRGQTKRRDSFTPSEANAATPLHDLKCSPNRPVSRHGPGSSPDAPRSLVVPVPVPVPDSPATGGGLAPSPLPASTSAPAVTSFIPDHKGCPTCALHQLQRRHTSLWHAPGGTQSIIQLVVQHARRPWEQPTLNDEINMRRVCSLVNQYANCNASRRITSLELCEDCEERYLFEMD